MANIQKVKVSRKETNLALRLSFPVIPDNWDFEKSIHKVKPLIYKWNNITQKIADELWVAREILSSQGTRTDLTSVQMRRSWSAYCKELGVAKSTVNRWLALWFTRILPEPKTSELPKGKYSIIYADPPWNYADQGCHGTMADHYKGMEIEDICALPIHKITGDNCILFLWATYPMLKEALQVIESWGFIYKTIAFQWLKLNPKGLGWFYGLGRWTRGNTEPCLLATKGKPKRISADVFQLIDTPRMKHSKKPNEARKRIIKLVGDLPRIELFAREKTKGWAVWGNEV